MSAPWCLTGWACAPARLDFNRALREKPDFAEAYNFIGVIWCSSRTMTRPPRGVLTWRWSWP